MRASVGSPLCSVWFAALRARCFLGVGGWRLSGIPWSRFALACGSAACPCVRRSLLGASVFSPPLRGFLCGGVGLTAALWLVFLLRQGASPAAAGAAACSLSPSLGRLSFLSVRSLRGCGGRLRLIFLPRLCPEWPVPVACRGFGRRARASWDPSDTGSTAGAAWGEAARKRAALRGTGWVCEIRGVLRRGGLCAGGW